MAFDVFSQVRCPSPNKKDTAIKNYKLYAQYEINKELVILTLYLFFSLLLKLIYQVFDFAEEFCYKIPFFR